MTTIEELRISTELWIKLKRKGVNFASEIRNFPLKTLKKDELIELLEIFLEKHELLEHHVQLHADDQVLIYQMDQEIHKLKNMIEPS